MNQARQDILEWSDAGRLSPAGLRRALELGGVLPDRSAWRDFLDRLLLWLGAVMLAASVVFFLAFNWQDLGRFGKFALAEALLLAAFAYAGWRGFERASGMAALVAAAILAGALFALVGQTYQTGADPYELFAVWAVAILPWALLGRLPALWVLWLVLVNLAVVLYFQAFHGVFGVLFGPERQAWLLFALNTLAWAAWEALARAGFEWLRARWAVRVVATASGACVTALALFAILDRRAPWLEVLAWLAWLGAAYAVYRRRIKDVYVLAGGVLSVIVVVAALLAKTMLDRGPGAGALLFIGLVVIGMSAAGGFWLKNVAGEKEGA